MLDELRRRREAVRRHLESSGEPWYMLAQSGGGEPWLAERGRASRHGSVTVNLIVGYGCEPGPWVKVGTWDYGITGPVPASDVAAQINREDITDRLVWPPPRTWMLKKWRAATRPKWSAACRPRALPWSRGGRPSCASTVDRTPQ